MRQINIPRAHEPVIAAPFGPMSEEGFFPVLFAHIIIFSEVMFAPELRML